MTEPKIFFFIFSILGSYTTLGRTRHINFVEKMQNHCTLMYSGDGEKINTFQSHCSKVSEELSEKEKYIGELIYRYLTIFQFNCHAILEGVPDTDEDFISG